MAKKEMKKKLKVTKKGNQDRKLDIRDQLKKHLDKKNQVVKKDVPSKKETPIEKEIVKNKALKKDAAENEVVKELDDELKKPVDIDNPNSEGLGLKDASPSDEPLDYKKEHKALHNTWQLSLKKRKNAALKEKMKLQVEKEKVAVEFTKLKKKLQLSKVKQKEVELLAKREIAKSKAQSVIDSKADKEIVKEKKNNILKKKKNIEVMKKEMQQKLSLQISQNVIKGQDINKTIKLTKEKIKQEKRKAAHALKIQREEEKEKAKRMRLELKQEQAELKEKLKKEKLEHKKDVINKQLELRIEMDQHKQQVQAKLLAKKKEKQQEIAAAKRETAILLQEQALLKAESSKARIKSRLKMKEAALDTDKDIELVKENIGMILSETEHEVNLIKEKGKLIEKFEEEKKGYVSSDAKIIEQEEIYDEEFDSEFDSTQPIDVDGESQDYEYISEEESLGSPLKSAQDINREKTKEDIELFIKSWKNFDKKGEKLMKKVQDPTTEKEMKKYSKSEYFRTVISNYQSLNTNKQLVSFKDIISNAYIIGEESIDEEVVDMVYNTIVKAILNKLRVKIGNYFIVPSRVEGNRTYVVVQNLSYGEKLFDLSQIISDNVAEGISQIIDYKLVNGSAVRIIDGLAVENFSGDLQVAIDANVLRLG